MDLLPLSALSNLILQKDALSRAGERIVRDVQYGGPEDPTDRRLILDTRTLRQLLEVAESSITGRVIIHHAGVRCRQYESGGHLYEVITLVGDQPISESVAFLK